MEVFMAQTVVGLVFNRQANSIQLFVMSSEVETSLIVV